MHCPYSLESLYAHYRVHRFWQSEVYAHFEHTPLPIKVWKGNNGQSRKYKKKKLEQKQHLDNRRAAAHRDYYTVPFNLT